MNSLDIFFVSIAGFFLFRGIFRGLILEISSIAGFLAGFLAANKFYGDLQPVAARIIPGQEWSQAAAYLFIFVTTMFAVSLFSLFLKKLLRMIMLGWLDRLGGGLLGFVKAGLICSLTLLMLTVFLPKNHELLTTSRISPHISAMSRNLSGFLPEELKDEFRAKADTARSFLRQNWEGLSRPESGAL